MIRSRRGLDEPRGNAGMDLLLYFGWVWKGEHVQPCHDDDNILLLSFV